MDQLVINGLAAKTRIGVHPWEQAIEQTLRIDISIPVDLNKDPEGINQTVDYSAVCETVINYIENNNFVLIEHVANALASLLKETFSLEAIEICVHKPNAIVQANDVYVKIARYNTSTKT